MILEDGELVGEPVMAKEVEQPEVDLIRRDDVEIPGVLFGAELSLKNV